jgi:hypothetical protein
VALGCATHINPFPGRKDFRSNVLTDLVFIDIFGSKLVKIPVKTAVSLELMPPKRLVQPVGGNGLNPT